LELIVAYAELLAPCADAQKRQTDSHVNAVLISQLHARGCGDAVLLWLLYRDHLEHWQPASRRSGRVRDPRPVNSVRLLETSSLALTHAGEAFAKRLLADAGAPPDTEEDELAWDEAPLGRLIPKYDGDNRVFAWGQHVIKCFRQPSENQEGILAAAEELGWPLWFDDPLPRHSRMNAKLRLHDTIKNLNRNQLKRLVPTAAAGGSAGSCFRELPQSYPSQVLDKAATTLILASTRDSDFGLPRG
jgi:hypothetical protein